jgi:outer membrane protein, multidrug efflux system
VGGNQSSSRGLTVSALGTWSIGPTLSLPIFDAGKRRAQVDSKVARVDQAYIAWRNTVLKGLEEVENALANYRNEQTRRKALARSVESSRASYKQTKELYSKGLTTFLDVLDTERSVSEAQNALVESDALLSRNVVALYKSLGGGWEVLQQTAKVN